MWSLFIKRYKIFFILLLFHFSLYSLPSIDFRNDNSILKQLKSDILENRKRLKIGKDLLPLQLFKYKIRTEDTIFSVSSRFNLTYDTIATLNKVDNQLFFQQKEHILIPNCPGLFVDSPNRDILFIETTINNENVFFNPGDQLDSKTRLNFLISPFKNPLKKMKITSAYGYRENPFSGINELHPGIDLKAGIGTKIFSPYSGVIDIVRYNDFLGHHLIIDHDNGYKTVYYHLNKIKHKKGDVVQKGDLIAYTGNSGRSTGPHLHFEIRKNDEPINPVTLLGSV